MAEFVNGSSNGNSSHSRKFQNGKSSTESTNGIGKTESRTGGRDANKEEGQKWFKTFLNQTILPIILVPLTTNLVTIVWYTVVHCDGSYWRMLSLFAEKSVPSALYHIWSLTRFPSPFIVMSLVLFSVYALATMILLPGKKVYGPLTPKGNVPEYKDNGFSFFVVTMVLFWSLTFLLRPFGFTPSIYYDRFDEIIIILNVFSFVFCILLYVKGQIAPSSSDSGSSGNFIFDFYWGMELYPRIFGFDVKVFTNCRFGLMIWTLMVCIHVIKSYELHGFVDSMFVSALLQIVYLGKFYWWEAGYMSTIDIMLDRAGYYICWGCMVFVPGIYTSVTFYLVTHPNHLGSVFSAAILFAGLLSIYANYDADAQKQKVRQSNGQCLIWGRKPEIIRARYQLENGGVKESILLASGWWGVSRHFHYVSELTLAFLWSLPALFHNVMPYSYFTVLFIILVHRIFRDEEKCIGKYGQFWSQYCSKVPYRIVPHLF